jgi:TatD DNase family protein
VFERVLAAAREQDKAVHLHAADAENEILGMLDRYQIRRVIIHWHAGSPDTLSEMVARGFWFTIAPPVFKSALIQKLARELPLAQLLTETDNPGGWDSVTGGTAGWPGMPRHLIDVIKAVAGVRGTTPEAIEDAV